MQSIRNAGKGQTPCLWLFTLVALVWGLLTRATGADTTVREFDSVAKDEPGQEEEAFWQSPTNICKTNFSSSAGQLSNGTFVTKVSARPRLAAGVNHSGDTNLFARLTNKYDPDIVLGIIGSLPPELQRRLGHEPPRGWTMTNDAATSRELLKRLGYPAEAVHASGSPAWRLEREQMTAGAMGTNSTNHGAFAAQGTRTAQLEERHSASGWPKTKETSNGQVPLFLRPMQSVVLLGGLSAMAVMYFYVSWCCRQLCWRTGTPTQILVWLPLLKRFPLFRATGVSRLWFWVGLVVPFVGLAGWALCCWRLCGAFNRSRWLTLAMALPVVWWIPFIYLEAATRAEDDEIAVKRLKAGYAF